MQMTRYIVICCLGKTIFVRNGGLYPDWQYRLFKRKYGRWESKDVHAMHRAGELKARFEYYP